MAFKKGDGVIEKFEMTASLMEVMNMLKIQDLSEGIGKKYEMETDGA